MSGATISIENATATITRCLFVTSGFDHNRKTPIGVKTPTREPMIIKEYKSKGESWARVMHNPLDVKLIMVL